MKVRTRALTIAGLALGMLFSSLPAAEAAHHLVRIKQVYPGAGTATEFIVLQLGGNGENQFTFGGGSELRFYDSAGQAGSEAFVADPTNGQSQRTVLAATPDAETAFSVNADLEMDDSNFLEDNNGAVCFQSVAFGTVDCVGWGGGTASSNPPSGMGMLEAAIPAGNMLDRSIAANCATLFELGDDTDDSAANFGPAAITPGVFVPRNNAAAIEETSCSPPPGGGGGGSGGSTNPGTTQGTAQPPKCRKGQKLVKGKCRKKKKKKRKK